MRGQGAGERPQKCGHKRKWITARVTSQLITITHTHNHTHTMHTQTHATTQVTNRVVARTYAVCVEAGEFSVTVTVTFVPGVGYTVHGSSNDVGCQVTTQQTALTQGGGMVAAAVHLGHAGRWASVLVGGRYEVGKMDGSMALSDDTAIVVQMGRGGYTGWTSACL